MENSAVVWILVALIVAAIIAMSGKAKEEEEKKPVRTVSDRRAERHASIITKYGLGEVAQRIIDKVIWTGETEEQLRDSMGDPLDIDDRVFKTKRKQIWKYYRIGPNRYACKITLENGTVVGWDMK